MQVAVSHPPAGPAHGGPRGRGITSVGPPATTAGDLPKLLHIQVDHVPGEGRGNRGWGPVVLPAGVQVFAAGNPRPVQPTRERAQARPVALGRQFVVDAPGGPSLLPPPGINQLDHFHRQACGPGGRGAGVILQSVGATGLVAGHPFREGGPGDTGLGGHMGHWSSFGDDAGDEALSSGGGQWGVCLGHETGLLLGEVGC